MQTTRNVGRQRGFLLASLYLFAVTTVVVLGLLEVLRLSHMMFAGFLILIALAAWVSHILFRDFFSPLGVYCYVWFSVFALFNLRLIDYSELETRTIAYLALGTIAFIAGCAFARFKWRPKATAESVARGIQFSPSRARWALFIGSIILALSVLLVAGRIHSLFGLSQFVDDPRPIRAGIEEWTHWGWLGPIILLDVPFTLIAALYVMVTRKWNVLVLLIFGFALVRGFLATGRLTLFLVGAAIFMMWAFLRASETSLKKVIGWTCTTALVGVALFHLLGTYYQKVYTGDEAAYEFVSVPVRYSWSVSPYHYSTAGLVAFQIALHNEKPLSFGAMTFYPVSRFLSLVIPKRQMPEKIDWAEREFVRTPVWTNNYTYLLTAYRDFGTTGLLVLPFCYGFALTVLYLHTKAHSSLVLVYLLGLGNAGLLTTILHNYFSTTAFWFYGLAGGGLLYLLERRGRVRSA